MNAQVKAIRDEIERMLTFDGSVSTSYYIGKRDAERELKAFIDSIQDEPTPLEKCEETAKSALKKCEEVDLEKELQRYCESKMTANDTEPFNTEDAIEMAKHFYELGKQAKNEDN